MRRVITAAVLGLTLGVVGTLVVPRPSAPPDYLGEPVAPVIYPAGAGPSFRVHRNCRVGRFGVAPWLKPGAPKDARWEQMTRLALAAMDVPPDAGIAALRGPPAGTIDVGNTDGQFHTTYRAGDRYVACLDSQTRFATDGQRERADVYHVGGVMLAVFRVCGNVSRVFPVPAAPIVGVPLLPVPVPAAPTPRAAPDTGSGLLPPAPVWGPQYIPLPPGASGGGTPPTARDVPEPGVLGLVIAGLIGLALRRK